MSADKTNIEQLAYRIWEEEGRPEGRDLDHWLQAEARARPATPPKAAKVENPKAAKVEKPKAAKVEKPKAAKAEKAEKPKAVAKPKAAKVPAKV